MENELNLIKDVIQICKYLCWQDDRGDEMANHLIGTIHGGKYGSHEGIWPQVEKAMNKIEQITQHAADLSGTTSKGKGKHHGPQGG